MHLVQACINRIFCQLRIRESSLEIAMESGVTGKAGLEAAKSGRLLSRDIFVYPDPAVNGVLKSHQRPQSSMKEHAI